MSPGADAPLVLGLDIGGSSSRGRLSEGGRIVAEATAPGANVALIDAGVVEERLTSLVEQLGSPHPATCCAGAAGAEVPAGKRRLEDLLAKLLPGAQVLVVHDTRLILAAAGQDVGIALIAGTGSVAYARNDDGDEARAGGWGWMLGDEGSGAWLVREALRELMRRREEGHQLSVLGERMLVATESDDLLETISKVQLYHEAGQWAALASVVFESMALDAGAARIIDSAADALASLALRAGAKVGVDGPVVMAGGLLTNFPELAARVEARVGSAGVLDQEPVAGAVRIAESL
ncbi:MAG TPA: BadF/BadG/BcrA/BcrD ATPase family protein [Candidatus Dormibacteraeota bacterium]|nr:BadF/BadG/BcrA/BcrD ATPase family protein [Candidatus Dormibacteraeota bacterium]